MVFISSTDVTQIKVKKLITFLKKNRITVYHSPTPPSKGNDPKWKNWYDNGLLETLNKCNTFIAIITDDWECATWMGQEAGTAENLYISKKITDYYYIDLRTKNLMSKGMAKYLKTELKYNMKDIKKKIVDRSNCN
jgi:hypothetical protein